MAESDNILTKLQDLLVYLVPQLNKFPRDQKFVLGDRIETKLLDVQEDCLQRKRPEMKTHEMKTHEMQMQRNNRPHPGPLPQERERRSPRRAGQDACGCSSSERSFPLSPGERAGVRASLALLTLLFLSATSTHAQTYSIDWSKISGGGGTSTGGVFSVSGTIGQPDAGGPMTNGQFSVTGGFWVLPTAVQTAGAPTLTIAPAAPGQATISWTPPTPGFVLQESFALTPGSWTNSVSGATNPVVVPATPPKKFYRLLKP